MFFYLYAMAFATLTISLSAHIIDVVIPCHEKDRRTLELAIQGIRRNAKDVRRIIIVSAAPLSQNAEWFDEKKYPFSKNDVLDAIFDNQNEKEAYASNPDNRTGWIYQQLLKLYAPFVIPGISENVLLVDADTVFLRPVEFIDKNGFKLYNVGKEYTLAYFEHAQRLLPGFKKIFNNYSGICHHMLLHKKMLERLFAVVESNNGCECWKALCKNLDKKALFGSPLSEYELYFNFVFSLPMDVTKAKIRTLTYCDKPFSLNVIKECQKKGYDYVSCHTWMS